MVFKWRLGCPPKDTQTNALAKGMLFGFYTFYLAVELSHSPHYERALFDPTNIQDASEIDRTGHDTECFLKASVDQKFSTECSSWLGLGNNIVCLLRRSKMFAKVGVLCFSASACSSNGAMKWRRLQDATAKWVALYKLPHRSLSSIQAYLSLKWKINNTSKWNSFTRVLKSILSCTPSSHFCETEFKKEPDW